MNPTVSFRKSTANIAANNGVDDTTADAFEAPTRLMEWKLKNRPPKKVINPAKMNQIKAIGAKDKISS